MRIYFYISYKKSFKEGEKMKNLSKNKRELNVKVVRQRERKFGLVWFGLVLWHTNHLAFNAKSSLYIYH